MVLQILNDELLLADICTVTTIALYLSGLGVVKCIIKKGSTHGISILPFLTCAVSCTIWLKYALLKKDYLLIITNLFGTLLEWLYVLIYLIYLPTEIIHNTSIRRWLTVHLVFMFSILVTSAQPKYSEKEMDYLLDFMVKICVFTNICNYFSPFGQALTAIKSKSTENLSFILSITYWLQVIVWLKYGLVTNKIVIIIPNALGVFLSSFILSLFFIYPNRRRNSISSLKSRRSDSNLSKNSNFTSKSNYSEFSFWQLFNQFNSNSYKKDENKVEPDQLGDMSNSNKSSDYKDYTKDTRPFII